MVCGLSYKEVMLQFLIEEAISSQMIMEVDDKQPPRSVAPHSQEYFLRSSHIHRFIKCLTRIRISNLVGQLNFDIF